MSDVLEAVNQSDSELDELSSGAESLDGWPSSDDNDLGGDRSDDFHSSDDEPLSSVAKNIPGRAQQPRGKGKKKVYKFDTRKPFTPPPDIDCANVTLEPESTDGTPYEYFKKFVNDDMFDNLATESNNYAHQKSGINLKTTASELETFVGMYFHTGVVKMPSVGCYWEAETRYPAVADMMSRNRFQKITSYLHIKDNILVTDAEKLDRAWKIRCWLDDLNANFATVSPSEYQCVDEIMVAFKGRSLLKQYLPKKPKKWGFKLWARCAATGFLHVFDIYQGKGTGMGTDGDLPDCGLGGNVVLKLCSSLPENHNFKIFADNFFSNFSMVSELQQRSILCWYNQCKPGSWGPPQIRKGVEEGRERFI